MPSQKGKLPKDKQRKINIWTLKLMQKELYHTWIVICICILDSYMYTVQLWTHLQKDWKVGNGSTLGGINASLFDMIGRYVSFYEFSFKHFKILIFYSLKSINNRQENKLKRKIKFILGVNAMGNWLLKAHVQSSYFIA